LICLYSSFFFASFFETIQINNDMNIHQSTNHIKENISIKSFMHLHRGMEHRNEKFCFFHFENKTLNIKFD
jgi:hypothetical protein